MSPKMGGGPLLPLFNLSSLYSFWLVKPKTLPTSTGRVGLWPTVGRLAVLYMMVGIDAFQAVPTSFMNPGQRQSSVGQR